MMENHPKLRRAVEILEALVGFNTDPAHDHLPLAEFVDARLRQAGAKTMQDRKPRRASVLGVIGDGTPGGVVLSGHSDVVDALGQTWRTDPFQLTEQNGKLFARGACDMKGFLACVLAVVDDFAAAKLCSPLYVAVSRDEEIGSVGMPDMLKLLHAAGASPAAAIVGEPTRMGIIAGLKAGYEMRATFQGVEAHSSMPSAGVSATAHAAQFAVFLRELSDEMAANPRPESPFVPPHGTINIGKIHGGTAHNIIAGRCVVDWHYRTLPDEDGGDTVARCESYIADTLLPMMRQGGHSAAAANNETLTAYPGLRPGESPALALARKLLGAEEYAVASFGADAGYFQAHGIPAVLVGPGDIMQAHKPDEYVEISQLDECLIFLDKLRARMQAAPI